MAGGPVVPGRFRSTQAVQDWVRSHDAKQLCTTAITVAEIGYRIERLPGGRRKEILRAAAAKIFETFAEQVLPFDTSAAEQYGLVVSQRDRLGLPIEGSMRGSPRSSGHGGPWLPAIWPTSTRQVSR